MIGGKLRNREQRQGGDRNTRKPERDGKGRVREEFVHGWYRFELIARFGSEPGSKGNKKGLPKKAFLYGLGGSPTWTRTRDLRINSPSLYQLSYQGTASNYSDIFGHF